MRTSLLAMLFAIVAAGRVGAAESKAPVVAEVEAVLEAWRLAWEETAKVKNVDKLRTFYDPRFRKIDTRRNLDQQMKRFLTQAKAATEIKVQLSAVKVTASKGAVITEFNQTYAVPNYFEEGKKRLVWKKDGTWKILEENFREDKSFVEGVKKRINKLAAWPVGDDLVIVKASARGFSAEFGDVDDSTKESCRFTRWVRIARSSIQLFGVCKSEYWSCHQNSQYGPRKCRLARSTKSNKKWALEAREGDVVVDGKSLNDLAREK